MNIRPLFGADAVCTACGGEGFVEFKGEAIDGKAGVVEIDACRRCTRRAEAVWRFHEEQRRLSMWNEHTNRRGRGSDPSAVRVAATSGRFILTVGRGALELMPWYRAGVGVAVLLGHGADAGRMRVMRGDTHRLLSNRGALEKLPPVILRVDMLPEMSRDAEHPAEAAAHQIGKGLLEVMLPSWAAAGTPTVVPPDYRQGYFMPFERQASPLMSEVVS